SIRGPKGGYVLSKDTGAITVGDIVKTLEGPLYPVHCVTAQKGARSVCRKSKGCVPKFVWLKLAKTIGDCLESITLKDLCAEAKRIDKGR
ncbi:MAG: Rrf2 family transcriptional regulator, partial [Candidatus Omnitrophota bacterium]|nr:Rrf2 family transcriptional regulator [Candidatus Omnitrophota bacterium]